MLRIKCQKTTKGFTKDKEYTLEHKVCSVFVSSGRDAVLEVTTSIETTDDTGELVRFVDNPTASWHRASLVATCVFGVVQDETGIHLS